MGLAFQVSSPQPLPQYSHPARNFWPLGLPLPILEQHREPHLFVGGKGGESQILLVWKWKGGLWGTGQRMGWACLASCVITTLPMQAPGSPQLCPQTQIPSGLLWDPHLCQNTVLSQKCDQGPFLPQVQVS